VITERGLAPPAEAGGQARATTVHFWLEDLLED
jgi:hypothetical protein